MTKTIFTRLAPCALAALALAAASPAYAVNLVLDNSFEVPLLGPGGFQTGFQTFSVGNTFGTGNPWLVIGSEVGNVAVYPSSETIGAPPTFLNVAAGFQALDLTGDRDNGALTGVRQVIGTTIGQSYSLSFFVGESNNQAASVLVSIDGNLFQTATNGDATSGFTTLWNQYSYTFTATSSATTLDFVNGSVTGTALVGLDAIQVAPGTVSESPEPGSVLMMLGGLAVFGIAGVRRKLL